MMPYRLLLAGLLFLSPFSLAQKNEPNPQQTLIIISTADIHGNISQFPKLATLVKSYRNKYPHVLLVDSGDYFMGSPYVDDWKTPGEPLTILMNKLGYNVATIGNHDLDYGQEALRKHIKGTPGITYILTNASPSPTLENCFSPYYSMPLKNSSVSVGFIGLVDFQTTDVLKMDGLAWELPDQKAYKEVTDSFRLNNNTINIVLSHLGYDHDGEMMKYSPNINVIFGGHSHVTLPHGQFKHNTLLSHTGARLHCAGVTTIVFSEGKQPSILSQSTEAIPLNDTIPNDPEFEKLVRQFTNNPFFCKQITTAMEDIPHSSMGYYLCQAIKTAVNADIALYNRGGVRAKTQFPKGAITIKDIYEMEPFRDTIVTCRMSKADVEQLILTKFMTLCEDEGGILDVYCAGFTYQITEGPTPSITSSLKPGMFYTVAMGDYLCNNFEFPQKGEGKATGQSVRNALIDFLSRTKELFNPPPTKPQIIRQTTYSL